MPKYSSIFRCMSLNVSQMTTEFILTNHFHQRVLGAVHQSVCRRQPSVWWSVGLLQRHLSGKCVLEISHEQSPQTQIFAVLDCLDLVHEFVSQQHGQNEVPLCVQWIVSRVQANSIEIFLDVFCASQEFQQASRHSSQALATKCLCHCLLLFWR